MYVRDLKSSSYLQLSILSPCNPVGIVFIPGQAWKDNLFSKDMYVTGRDRIILSEKKIPSGLENIYRVTSFLPKGLNQFRSRTGGRSLSNP